MKLSQLLENINRDELKKGKIIEFTCNGKGRGGHYGVKATIDKVNPKTVSATEAIGSYKPGAKWNVAIDQINKIREPWPKRQCDYCKGTGEYHQGGKPIEGRKCVMCNGTGKLHHESDVEANRKEKDKFDEDQWDK